MSSYNEDIVQSKLSTLNGTQDSIVNVSQWVMFHKRNAGKTAQIWAQMLQEYPAAKKLPLVYLANEVIQQTKARGKVEFEHAFRPLIGDALSGAYRQVPKDVKDKIKRVVDVWRQRAVFEGSVLDDIDSKLKEQGQGGGGLMQTFNSTTNIPPDLKDVVTLKTTIDQRSKQADPEYDAAVKEYTALFDSDALPAPPVYSKRIGEIQQKLGKCLDSYNTAIDSRKKIVEKLRRIADENENAIKRQEERKSELDSKLEHANQTKKEVDEMLVEPVEEPDAPEVEALTPPGDPPQAPEPEQNQEEGGGGIAEDEEYVPGEDTSNSAPAYSPLSSDEEEEEQPKKKQKTASFGEPAEKKPASVEGLDPKVAQLLASMQKK